MSTVTVSPKYQVVIPKDVRKVIDIRPGQKVAMIAFQGRIQIVPLKPIEEMRGFLKGMDTTIEHEPDREL
jgi:AbrB family looped-hinge helix DNA binding protein